MTKEISKIIQNLYNELSVVSRSSQNTLNAYKRDLKDFLEFCHEKNIFEIEHINAKHLKLYLMLLNEKKYSKSSVARKLSAIRKLFNYAVKNDIIKTNPIKTITGPSVKRKLPETISSNYYEEILNLIDKKIQDSEEKIRDKAIFELLYGCALRVTEICNLDKVDIDLVNKNVRVLGKGSKVRIVPIGSKSIPIISDYIKLRIDNNPALFIDEEGNRINRFFVYRLVKKFLKETELKKKSPHILRHSAATHMLDRDADLLAIKEILGHENLSTTQIYTRVSIERIKKIYKQAHPKSLKE